jgi:hypothetical protein
MWATIDKDGTIKKWYNSEPIRSADGTWFSSDEFPDLELEKSIYQLELDGYIIYGED